MDPTKLPATTIMLASARSPVAARLALALLALLARPHGAYAQDEKLLVLRGRVLQQDGTPIARARIRVEGLRGGGARTDAGGSYQIDLRLGSDERLAAEGLRLRVSAEKAGFRLALPGGSPALEVQLSCREASACTLRTSDVRVGEALSRALGPGGAGGAVALLNFIGTRETWIYGSVRAPGGRAVVGCVVEARARGGAVMATATTGSDGSFALPVTPSAGAESIELNARNPAFEIQPASRTLTLHNADRVGPVRFSASPRPDALPDQVAAALGAASRDAEPSPSPPAIEMVYTAALVMAGAGHSQAARDGAHAAIPATAAPTASRPAGGSPGEHAAPSSAVLVPTTLLSTPLAAPLPAGGAASACDCRVEGILELRSPTPVEPAPRMEVSLSPDVGVRDTVDFFLGVPRPFTLARVPCGRYAIRVRNLGASRWLIVNPQGLGEVHCEGESATEIRVLLERRP